MLWIILQSFIHNVVEALMRVIHAQYPLIRLQRALNVSLPCNLSKFWGRVWNQRHSLEACTSCGDNDSLVDCLGHEHSAVREALLMLFEGNARLNRTMCVY